MPEDGEYYLALSHGACLVGKVLDGHRRVMVKAYELLVDRHSLYLWELINRQATLLMLGWEVTPSFHIYLYIA